MKILVPAFWTLKWNTVVVLVVYGVVSCLVVVLVVYGVASFASETAKAMFFLNSDS